jgi:Glycine cleavage system T protein (aminomethyltransferase)
MGLRCKTSEPMVLSEVIANNTHAGVISAASWSPFLSCGIGYVRLNQSGHKSGEIIEIHGVDGNVHEAELVELPFYDKAKKIPRGL